MAQERKPVDVVLVGMGWTNSIVAKELLDAGYSVVALERGGRRHTAPDFQAPQMHDELKFAVRYALMQDTTRETITFRNTKNQTALPMRRLGSFLPGSGLGGAGVHWNGQTWRFLPSDFEMYSHYAERYGKDIFDDELTVQDWGVTYDELRPHYETFEKICGVSGIAGNING